MLRSFVELLGDRWTEKKEERMIGRAFYDEQYKDKMLNDKSVQNSKIEKIFPIKSRLYFVLFSVVISMFISYILCIASADKGNSCFIASLVMPIFFPPVLVVLIFGVVFFLISPNRITKYIAFFSILSWFLAGVSIVLVIANAKF